MRKGEKMRDEFVRKFSPAADGLGQWPAVPIREAEGRRRSLSEQVSFDRLGDSRVPLSPEEGPQTAADLPPRCE